MNAPTAKAIALSATSVIMTIGLAAGLIANTTWGLIVMVALAVTHFGLRIAGRNGLVHRVQRPYQTVPTCPARGCLSPSALTPLLQLKTGPGRMAFNSYGVSRVRAIRQRTPSSVSPHLQINSCTDKP